MEAVTKIIEAHQTIDAVYGHGFSRRNAHIVAQFMQAFAQQTQAEALRDQAAEIATLREILSSGEGGLTVGIEKS